MYFEWIKMFKHFGSALAIAFKGKKNIIILIYNFLYRY
jgi:hypothetical protein